MADVYRQTYLAEPDPRITLQATPVPPAFLRLATWVSGLVLSGFVAMALFALASRRWPQVLHRGRLIAAPKSRLLELCVDVPTVPPGAVCAVCLEDGGDGRGEQRCQ